ncbi:MAG TPA: YihY/virulence factor BrkB family protein [Solirubrobacterales bacterium]|nr:YihY/virulence factor BrkB family protein [Solirubrobacterales bacterium]
MDAASPPPPEEQSRPSRPRRREPATRLHLRDLRARIFVDAVGDFLDDHMNDWAAALTFYAGISLLPALVIVLGVLGLLDDSTLDGISGNLNDQNEGPVRDLAIEALDQVRTNAVSAGVAVLVGIVGALWSASSYVGGFLRASGVVHGRTVRYPVWKLRPLQMALTAGVMVAIAGTALFVVITGPIARDIASVFGLEDVFATSWDLAKWPLIVLFVLTIFAVLYWAAPDVRERGFQLITPGGLIATATWVIGSVGYAIYVESFADYNKLYGSLGAVIGFLIWLWLSNMAMLYGVELNARLERESDARRAG